MYGDNIIFFVYTKYGVGRKIYIILEFSKNIYVKYYWRKSMKKIDHSPE